MDERTSGELYLRGRIQVSTAIGALAYSGANRDALLRLQIILDVHEQLSTEEAQNDLHVCLQGEYAAQAKSDIKASLEQINADSTIEKERRLAAAALYEVLQ